jgi:predicted dehydrogenase
MDFENGQMGYLGSVAATGSLWQVRAFGTAGWASIFAHDEFTAQKIDGTFVRESWDGYAYPGMLTIKDQIESFARACAGGDPFSITPDQIMHATAVLEAVIKSVDTGGRVSVA